MGVEASFIFEAGTALLVLERCYDKLSACIAARRRAKGRGLEHAFHQTALVMDSLYQLYREIGHTEGFHSIRMLNVHDSGRLLANTMLWKGTVLATFPHDADDKYRWDEKPLDSEYLSNVLEPVSENRRRCVKRSELAPDGQLGAQYARLGIEQSLLFLISKSDSEIVFGSVSFSTSEMTPQQIDAIYACESQIASKLKG